MPPKKVTVNTSYSPVNRRDTVEEPQVRQPRGVNPFEDRILCLGKSMMFWIVAVTIFTVIAAVILTVTLVLAYYHFGDGPIRFCLEDYEGYSRDEFSEGSNDFGRGLYHKLTETNSNSVVMSSFSLYSVLAMLTAGAQEQTEMELKGALGLPCANDSLWLDAYRNIRVLFRDRSQSQDENSPGSKFVLESANKMFVNQEFQIVSSFRDTSVEKFSSDPERIDFSQPGAVNRVNNWIESNTHGKIKDMLDHGSVNAQTRLVLVNAVYFKAGWKYPFDKTKTSEDTFMLNNQDSVQIDMMHLQASLKVKDVADLEAEVVRLPYYGNEAEMIIVLPNEGVSLRKIESKLMADESLMNQILDDSDESTLRIKLSLPKFKIESKHDLKPTLSWMGLEGIFVSSADFSGITGRKNFFVDQVLQQAFIEVDEKGTEAAAATALISRMAAIEAPEREIICNRPFLFIIRDTATGLNLFEGRLMSPTRDGSVSSQNNLPQEK